VFDKADTDDRKPKRRKGCLGLLWRLSLVGLVVLAGMGIWLNGPGIRWLGPKVAKHYLEKANFEGDFRIGGTVLGGIDIYDLDLRSEGSVERLVIDRLETDYRFTEVVKGKLRGISGDGVHLDLRLVEKPEEEDKPPMDFAELGKTLNKLHGLIIPVNLDLEEVSVSLKKDGELVVGIAGSSLNHGTGSELIELGLGMVTDSGGRTLKPQNAKIFWDKSKLTLDQLDLLPIVSVGDLEVLLPESGEIAATGKIRLAGAVLNLDVGAGISDVRLDLREGGLDFAEVMDGFGIELPISGKMTSLALEIRKVYPKWQTAVGSVEVFLEDFYYDGWGGPELALGLDLNEGEIGAKMSGQSLDTPFSIEGKGAFERAMLESGGFALSEFNGGLTIEEVKPLLLELDKKLDLTTDFGEFPESELGGSWALDLEGGFESVSANLTLKATEIDASSIRIDATYAGKVVMIRALETDGSRLAGSFDTETQGYKLSEAMDGFSTESIAPWLAGVGVELPGSGVVSLNWEGSGNLLSNIHKGALKDFSGTWSWKQIDGEPLCAPVSASTSISYDWPGSAEIDGLVVETEGQKIMLDVALNDNLLELEHFLWSEGEKQLAKGRGKLPVAEDFSKFKEFIANDTRPLDFEIISETLPLSTLRPWLKGLDQIGDEAKGKVAVKIGGSLAAPEVNAILELKNVSSPSQPDLPKTDVSLKIDAKDGVAEISAEATALNYAPATLKASMPFRPRKWADDPKVFMGEAIEGNLKLPRLELSRFQSLIPGAERLGGVATGEVVIRGTVGDPKVDGRLNLSGGSLKLEGDVIPGLEGVNFDIQTDLGEVTIKGEVDDLEGGNLTINGTLGLKNESGEGLGALDVSVRGRGVPVVRNDFLIMRANMDLNVKGTMESSLVSGDVGVIDSVFYKDIELIPIGKPFLGPSPAALPALNTPDNPGEAVPEAFQEWTVNVSVKTVDPILIRGNLGEGEVDASLRIEGKLGNPQPTGTVRLRDTAARLPFSTLEVSKGTLTFSPKTGFDPIVELRGNAEPRPYRIQVYAYGRMSDPQLVLTSQPPLPENEIMTLLATGTTSLGLEDSQAAASRATQLLIEELRRGRFLFGKQLRPVLGLLDNMDFSIADQDPYDSDSYNSATLKLSDKWFISAGLGAEGDQRVMAIYRLRIR